MYLSCHSEQCTETSELVPKIRKMAVQLKCKELFLALLVQLKIKIDMIGWGGGLIPAEVKSHSYLHAFIAAEGQHRELLA